MPDRPLRLDSHDSRKERERPPKFSPLDQFDEFMLIFNPSEVPEHPPLVVFEMSSFQTFIKKLCAPERRRIPLARTGNTTYGLADANDVTDDERATF